MDTKEMKYQSQSQANMTNDENTYVSTELHMEEDVIKLDNKENTHTDHSSDNLEDVVVINLNDLSDISVEKPGMKKWKKITIGGITGIALGAASAYAMDKFDFQDDDEDTSGSSAHTTEENGGQQNQTVTQSDDASGSLVDETSSMEQTSSESEVQATETPGGLRMASQAADGMTFGQAFANARAEIGPGGIFEFEGEIYSTYYETEWDNMSTDERMEYNEKLNAVLREEPGAVETTSAIPTVQEHEESVGEGFIPSEAVLYEEDNVLVVSGQVEGHNAVIIDDLATPSVDLIGVDVDKNDHITENEIINLSDSGITMDNILGTTPMDGQTPDVDPTPLMGV